MQDPEAGRGQGNGEQHAEDPGHGRPGRHPLYGLGVQPDGVLLDGNWDFVGAPNTRRIVKGDATCLSIAAASIVAKVTRDRLMRAEAENYPGYDFESNKGYPCPRHKMALAGMGPTSDPDAAFFIGRNPE